MEHDGATSILDEHPYVALGSAGSEPRRRSYAAASRRRSLIETPFFEVDEAAELILKANAPPKTVDGTIREMMLNIRGSKYRHDQFAKIQGQTGMSPSTLRFSRDYELGYRMYIQRAAVPRTRVCFALGFIATLLYFLWDVQRISYTSVTYFLAFGVAVPSFGVGFLLTYVRQLSMYTETLSFVVFSSVAGVLIALKPLHAQRGPVIPLLILIIPLFGVTRMRFLYSTMLGWSIFFTYMTVQLVARPFLGPAYDTRSDVFYQSINYGIALISGMVSHYRQELLRRRNYALKLPFHGVTDADCSAALQKDKFAKKHLVHRWSMEFRHAQVEDCFIRHWYLIDPFPFENPNAAVLHQGSFRVIRFTVMTVLLNQLFLAVQDYRLLHRFPNHLAEIGYGLRFGVVDVAYVSAAAFMYVVGRRYYKLWLASAREGDAALVHENESTNDNSDDGSSSKSSKHTTRRSGDVSVSTSRPSSSSWCPDWTTSSSRNPYSLVGEGDDDDEDVEGSTWRTSPRRWRVMAMLFRSDATTTETNRSQTSDVLSAQLYAVVVVALHATCMAAMLFVVGTSPASLALSDIYLMGFLNATVFAHRSGFRVRHKYAVAITSLIGIATICTAATVRCHIFYAVQSAVGCTTVVTHKGKVKLTEMDFSVSNDI
ncbi:hypothetical protein, variant 2 [Aphanomyces astaci]|uniref:Uncharacterized protein n=1 Tax=Aphanomyces astaci TaxID=112090 RepID=W4GNZ3_APHAT|nr:hypothetical protein, variant 3 [Aphanomyces astaci]XP_009829308.1 hypothetical protein, variant 2 [Aphanomyces astaci]ETV81449.1 hypothetical protein, variant 2 [Aphanomyces astaci]ETV81450.1 hypothetical protein, variant 3 [Aphanomyces astaci]|eukprot:XP_009829306.1 hypothetical protein, variant 3 [Aphanomyces astaci]